MTDRDTAAARLVCSWLLTYPDEALMARMDDIAEVVAVLPVDTGAPLREFLSHLADTPLMVLQQHFVQIFDMRRRACPYLSYWTDGGPATAVGESCGSVRRMSTVASRRPTTSCPITWPWSWSSQRSGPVDRRRTAGRTQRSDPPVARCAGVHELHVRTRARRSDRDLARVDPEVAERMAVLAASGPRRNRSAWNPSPRPRPSSRSELADERVNHRPDPALGRAALCHDRRLRGGHVLALPLRQVRLDHAVEPVVRTHPHPHRQPPVPHRDPGGRGRSRHRVGHPRAVDDLASGSGLPRDGGGAGHHCRGLHP